jgi:hypothetical protein
MPPDSDNEDLNTRQHGDGGGRIRTFPQGFPIRVKAHQTLFTRCHCSALLVVTHEFSTSDGILTEYDLERKWEQIFTLSKDEA